MGKMQKKFKQITLLLAMILLFAFAMPVFAQEQDITGGETSSEETSSEETSSEETSSEETSSEETSSEETSSEETSSEEPSSDPVVLPIMGDLNADGKVDSGEARTVLRVSVGLDEIDDAVAAYADMDHNGVINSGDAREVLRTAVGLTEEEQHAFVNGEVTAATCSAEGCVAYTCTHCELAGSVVLAKLPHDFASVTKTEATCTVDGLDEQVCTVCGEEKDIVLKAKGHTYEETSRTEATCTATGLVKSACSVCGDTKEETIKANGHSYKETKNQAATCTAAGVKEYTCSVCTDVLSVPSNALGHNMVRCTATTPQHCDRCGEKYTGVQQAASGLYYYYTKNGNTYSCAKNKIVGSSYYGPDGARVDDEAINAAVEFVNTYTDSSASNYSRFSTCYYIMVDYFVYGNNPDATQTPDGRHIPGYATQMFSEWKGNCYRFAAALAYCGRVLGFDVGFITGQISASGGGTTTHGLTTVKYNGTTYWCDAMMENKYPNYNSFMVTKNSYPYGYTANYSINMSVANGKVTWS